MPNKKRPYTVKDIIVAVEATGDYVEAIRRLLRGLPPSTKLRAPIRAGRRMPLPTIRIQRACGPPSFRRAGTGGER